MDHFILFMESRRVTIQPIHDSSRCSVFGSPIYLLKKKKKEACDNPLLKKYSKCQTNKGYTQREQGNLLTVATLRWASKGICSK